jgi:hypothetical protein
MSANKFDTSGIFQPFKVLSSEKCLSLPSTAVRIRKSGIEFKCSDPITPWTEMTVDLLCSADMKRVHCTGVVVACNGNRHTGYTVSMLFLNLSRQARERLDFLVFAQQS